MKIVTFDVTSSDLRAQFEREAEERGDSMHLWPAAYYAQVLPKMLKEENGALPKHGEGAFPKRGTVIA